MMDSSIPLVKVEGVTRVYRTGQQDVHALRGVDLEIPRGILAVLMGRSGSGKTTLLNLIGGLDQPDSGCVYFDGRPLAGMRDNELTLLRRKRIGFVFQSFALMPTYTAFENVEMLLRMNGLGRKERIQRARRCLYVVGLANWMGHRPAEMSGGQQQRLSIARAVVTRPDLILADEPTGELDSGTTRQIAVLFRHLVEQEGVTILLTTHNTILVEYADRTINLKDGEISAIADRGRVSRNNEQL
jgi:ABC-type lipoprotein export system ATPase subunit